MRTTPRPLAGAALAAALASALGAGCGDPSGGYYYDTTPPTLGPGGTGDLGSGTFLIGWTVAGQAPTAAACAGIDHLRLTIAYAGRGDITISPIPCALTRFRYDGVPEGDARFQLDAFDASGCRVGRGASATTAVSTTRPTDPAPIVAVPAPVACR